MDIGLSYSNPSYFDDFLEFLLKFSNGIILVFKFWFGIVGLFLLMPFIAILLVGLFILIYIQKLKLDRWVKSVYNSINILNDEDLIRIHLLIEKMTFRYRDIFKISKERKNDILFKQVYFQVSQIVHILNKAEETLRKSAYPYIDKPISEEHQKELIDKFESFDDWDDEELDVYDEVYC